MICCGHLSGPEPHLNLANRKPPRFRVCRVSYDFFSRLSPFISNAVAVRPDVTLQDTGFTQPEKVAYI
jgi:hypothetical protein